VHWVIDPLDVENVLCNRAERGSRKTREEGGLFRPKWLGAMQHGILLLCTIYISPLAGLHSLCGPSVSTRRFSWIIDAKGLFSSSFWGIIYRLLSKTLNYMICFAPYIFRKLGIFCALLQLTHLNSDWPQCCWAHDRLPAIEFHEALDILNL
jgi:hypothetical protein